MERTSPEISSPPFAAGAQLRPEYIDATRQRLRESPLRQRLVARFAERYRRAGYLRSFWLDLELEITFRREWRMQAPAKDAGADSDLPFAQRGAAGAIPPAEDVRRG